MIESISIANVATFGSDPDVLSGWSLFNFIFGSNGTGKTTISRVIAEEADFPTCRLGWKAGTKLQSMVYNRDFVDKNFNELPELKGVFTLGEESVDALAKIAAATKELDSIAGKLNNLNLGLGGEDGTGGKRGELADLETRFQETCWKQKQKHDGQFQRAFEGYRASAEKFKDKVLQEWTDNSVSLLPLEELQNRAKTVFGTTPTPEQTIPVFNFERVLSHESNPILNKRIIGKEDVDIAAMINRLDNSDWVREGRSLFAANEGVCPFCQRDTEEAFAKSLDEYFDEAFEADSKAIKDLAENYQDDSDSLQEQITEITATPSRFLDSEQFNTECELLASITLRNVQIIAGKKKEPSRAVELESIVSVESTIQRLVGDARSQIEKHNKMVENLSQERERLVAEVWKYLLEGELKEDLIAYKQKRGNLKNAINSMTTKIEAEKNSKAVILAEIQVLEKATTSIQPTINGINSLLRAFGFRGFSLDKAGTGTSYKLVREDGSDAMDTLSEGEKTFVTFLYFFHLLKGSNSEDGITNDRVVVFDDPVSSLDSDILFIVGTLIKGLFDEVREGTGHIKQIFILTHNVYFHKEVSFNPKRCDVAMNEETFWIVQKAGLLSKVDKHPSNPINTSYELLWLEVRKPNRSNLTIQNTLRRILENYFKILGGVDPDKICALFKGNEKLICKSLFSWVNAGSHYALDDLDLSINDGTVEIYLKVFRAIFLKSDHFAHYKMMMGVDFVEEPAEGATK